MEKYERMLTIAVPTYNHPEYIKFYLEQMDYIDEFNLVLEFHDSSTNNETRKLIEQSPLYNKNIFYYHYDNIDVDLKTILLLRQIKTKYVFLCGDGVILNVKEFYNQIYGLMLKNADLIELYDKADSGHYLYYEEIRKKYMKKEIQYNDIIQHFRDNYWHIPYYGGSIVKSQVFYGYDETNMSSLIGLGFVYPYMVYLYFAHKPINFVVLGDDYLLLNPYKKSSIWLKKGIGLKIWIDNYNSTISMLPEFYDENKQYVICTTGIRTNFFTFKGLLGFRAYNNINFKLFKMYKKQLVQISNVPIGIIFLISIFPKSILKFIRFIKRRFKK